jgi:hypothetical protein
VKTNSINSISDLASRIEVSTHLIRLICENPTPIMQDGEQVVFDLDPSEVKAKIAQLKALGWQNLTIIKLFPN